MNGKLIGAVVPSRFVRLGGETDVGFHKTHPSVCSFSLIVTKWLWWDRLMEHSWMNPAVRSNGEFC